MFIIKIFAVVINSKKGFFIITVVFNGWEKKKVTTHLLSKQLENVTFVISVWRCYKSRAYTMLTGYSTGSRQNINYFPPRSCTYLRLYEHPPTPFVQLCCLV